MLSVFRIFVALNPDNSEAVCDLRVDGVEGDETYQRLTRGSFSVDADPIRVGEVISDHHLAELLSLSLDLSIDGARNKEPWIGILEELLAIGHPDLRAAAHVWLRALREDFS